MSDALRPSRRDFLCAATAAVAGGLPAIAPPRPVDAEEPATPATLGISELRLLTTRLEEQRRFYADTLELPTRMPDTKTLVVQAGATTLTLRDADSGQPFYHYAFNIPENKLGRAKAWLKPRCPLLRRPDGGDEYDFRSWNAHSIYFLDPAGNILEFIARHNLPNGSDGPFGPREILYASEIGVVVDDVAESARAAQAALGVEPFKAPPSETFAAMGDDHRLLIVVRRGREWNIKNGTVAEVFPTHAVLAGPQEGRWSASGLPYEIIQRVG